MAFEINFFGSPVSIGSFGFFDLMDSVGSVQRAPADVVALDTSRNQKVVFVANDGGIQSAA